jgi:hypothetical protein
MLSTTHGSNHHSLHVVTHQVPTVITGPLVVLYKCYHPLTPIQTSVNYTCQAHSATPKYSKQQQMLHYCYTGSESNDSHQSERSLSCIATAYLY